MSLTDARAETAHDERLFGRPFDARQSQYRSPNGLPRWYRREIATLKQKEAVFPDRRYGQLFGTSSRPLGAMLPTGRFWPPRRYHPARPSQCQTKMIRTLKFALRYNPASSRAIGYYATQQNAAYNAAVDVLNREPKTAQAQRSASPRRPQQAHHRVAAAQPPASRRSLLHPPTGCRGSLGGQPADAAGTR